MRTNIDLNDELIARAQKYSTARSKRALVNEALATYVAVRTEEEKRRTYQERLEGIRKQARAICIKTDTRKIIRQDRDSR